jgi:hypothetical protein
MLIRAASSVGGPRALRRPHRQAKSKTPKARLIRWLERISSAWEDFQASRTRDAVYGYLDAVFAIVEHYRVRRRTKRLLRRAAEFSGLPLENNADPFTFIWKRCRWQNNQQMGARVTICDTVQRSRNAVENVYEGSRRGQWVCQPLCESL